MQCLLGNSYNSIESLVNSKKCILFENKNFKKEENEKYLLSI
jgi:hypothetical protein